MIDLQLDPFSPAHEADLALVGEELASDAGVGKDHLRVVGGWRAMSAIDPWYPTAQERRKGPLRRWRTPGRIHDAFDRLQGDEGLGQADVEELRRHCGGPYGGAAHQHWRALVVPPAVPTSSLAPSVSPSSAMPPPLPVLTDQGLVVLVRRTAGEMADAKDRLAALEAGARATSPLSVFRSIRSTFAKLGTGMSAIARGDPPTDLLVVRSKAPLVGSRVEPLSAVAPDDHLRWRFADGSWIDVRLPHPEPADRREVLRRIEAGGVTVGAAEPFLATP